MIENPTEWFLNKSSELESDYKRKNALLEMKSMVLNSEKRVLCDIARNVSINPVFECLNKCEDEEVDLISTILFELLSEITGNELLEKYGELLHRSSLHNSDVIRGTVLKLLEKNLNQNTAEILISKHADLLVNATACIASEGRGIAQQAISLFIKLGSISEGLKVLYSNLIVKKLKEVMASGDTARFRVYEIIVAVSKVSAENLTKTISTGLMENLILEISSSDILIELNALELLSSLASSNHGLSYLQEHKVIQTLVDKLLKINEEPLSAMLLPGLIEFFGNLCASQPEYFAHEYPQIMELLFNSLDTNDDVLLGVIITTVGKIGSTQSGRLILNKYESELKKNFFKRMGQILATKNDLAICSMNSLGELIKAVNGNQNLNLITKEWFQSITPNVLDSVVPLSKLPFIEFRLAAFALLKTMATQQWGSEILYNYPGMLEFLTDRSTEFNKDCKELKFGIIYNMLQCPNIEKVITQQDLLNLREFVREGPFYVPTQVEMATEGAT